MEPDTEVTIEPMNVESLSEFRREFLETHNKYRAKHNSPPLVLSEELTEAAQKWAEHLEKNNVMESMDAEGRTVEGASAEDYGENIYMATGIQVTGNHPVDKWYDELADYDFAKPGFNTKTGHLTQLLWKDSKQLGIGVTTSEVSMYVVAFYDPAGNIAGLFRQNVLETAPPKIDIFTQTLSLDVNKFEREFLVQHNKFREAHDVEPLKIDIKLSAYARERAQKYGENAPSEVILSGAYGESVEKTASNGALSAQVLANQWYEQQAMYDYDVCELSTETAKFTQMIWKGSITFGVGLYYDGANIFVVACYSPKGNIANQVKENVLPVSDKSKADSYTQT